MASRTIREIADAHFPVNPPLIPVNPPLKSGYSALNELLEVCCAEVIARRNRCSGAEELARMDGRERAGDIWQQRMLECEEILARLRRLGGE